MTVERKRALNEHANQLTVRPCVHSKYPIRSESSSLKRVRPIRNKVNCFLNLNETKCQCLSFVILGWDSMSVSIMIIHENRIIYNSWVLNTWRHAIWLLWLCPVQVPKMSLHELNVEEIIFTLKVHQRLNFRAISGQYHKTCSQTVYCLTAWFAQNFDTIYIYMVPNERTN